MTYLQSDKIFVQIPCYRDPELIPTLKDLFAKAKKPENIFVGICLQYDMHGDADEHLFEEEFPRKDQLRIEEFDYQESEGVSWARDKVQKLYNDEKWVMLIDSHMRFVEGWDEMMVNDIKNINQKNRIFSNACSLTKYCYKTGEVDFGPYALATSVFFKNPEFRCCGGVSDVKNIRPGVSFCCGFAFGDAKIMMKMQFDSRLKVHDEFPNMLKLFTFGANFYLYNKPVVAHLIDYLDSDKLITARSNTYVKTKLCDEIALHLTGVKKSQNSEVLDCADNYKFGQERSVRDYERYAGIDIRKKKVREKTKNSLFCKWDEVVKSNVIEGNLSSSKKKNIKIAFFPHNYEGEIKTVAENALFESYSKVKSIKNYEIDSRSFSSQEDVKKFAPDFILSWFCHVVFDDIPTYIMQSIPSGHYESLSDYDKNRALKVSGYLVQTMKVPKEMTDFYNNNGYKTPNILSGFFHSKPKNQYKKLDSKKLDLAYVSANWEYMVDPSNIRFGSLINYLIDQDVDFLNLYGQEKGWKWVSNFDKYVRGEISFDDDVLLNIYRSCGVGLAINGNSFYNSGAITARLLEVVASGAVCISDDNEVIREIFGDTILYVTIRDEVEMAKQIIDHMSWINNNKDEAIEKAKKAHEIFYTKLSMEHMLEKIIDFHFDIKNKKYQNIQNVKNIFRTNYE